MADTIRNRLKHAWNAFLNREDESPFNNSYRGGGMSFGPARPDRSRLRYTVERTLITSIYTRLSVDAASTDLHHVRLDDSDRYLEDIPSLFNECLTVQANIDQKARAFRQDIYLSLIDKGVIAIVPVDTTLSPIDSGQFDIKSMRVGEVVNWYPETVKVSVYNQAKGYREDIELPKSMVAIVENPFYPVMNEPNSTLQRLNHKLNLLDSVDEKSSSNKLDLIIQLPYVIKSEARRNQAEKRRKDIEFQLAGSQYGIAYTDGTERITQLNRPVENNLLTQIVDLRSQLYSELGLTEEILKGTADEKTMKNYFTRTIDPLVDAVVESMTATFLTKTARSQKQSVLGFRDPFRFVPINEIAEISDKFARNEIATSNEIRQAIGWRPSKDPKADELRNSNMPQSKEEPTPTDV